MILRVVYPFEHRGVFFAKLITSKILQVFGNVVFVFANEMIGKQILQRRGVVDVTSKIKLW